MKGKSIQELITNYMKYALFYTENKLIKYNSKKKYVVFARTKLEYKQSKNMLSNAKKNQI